MTNSTAISKVNQQPIDNRRGEAPVTESPRWTYRPNVDVYETPESIILHADLPGVDAGQINVNLEQGLLTIDAPAKARQAGSMRPLMQQYGVGAFHRRFSIDAPIDSDAVSAEYHDGVLTVTLPRSAESRPRQIPVKA